MRFGTIILTRCDDMAYTVYKHTSPNGKVYIGITSRKPEERWLYGHGYNNNKHFHDAIQKYGWENIEHTIIADGLTKEQAFGMEIELIAKYRSNDPEYGYNMSIGGEGGTTGVRLSEETRRRMSKSRTGEKHFGYGKHLSDGHRKKLSESHKGNHNRSKKVICIETGIIYESGREASKQTGTFYKSISNACLGVYKTAGGYHWRYIDDNQN